MTRDYPINRYLTRYPIAAVAIYAGVVFLLLFAAWVGVAGVQVRGLRLEGHAATLQAPPMSIHCRARRRAARHSSKGRR